MPKRVVDGRYFQTTCQHCWEQRSQATWVRPKDGRHFHVCLPCFNFLAGEQIGPDPAQVWEPEPQNRVGVGQIRRTPTLDETERKVPKE